MIFENYFFYDSSMASNFFRNFKLFFNDRKLKEENNPKMFKICIILYDKLFSIDLILETVWWAFFFYGRQLKISEFLFLQFASKYLIVHFWTSERNKINLSNTKAEKTVQARE